MGVPLSHAQIAEIMGISRQRVFQIEKAAIKKIVASLADDLQLRVELLELLSAEVDRWDCQVE